MKALVRFASRLADRMVQFIAFKRLQGYDYTAGANVLRCFDTFLSNRGGTGEGLCAPELDDYRAQIKGLNRATQFRRLSVVRQFSLYLHAIRAESAVLPKALIPRQPRSIRFCPLSPAQIGALMAVPATGKGDNAIRAYAIRFLIGLLYSTGLRISEALALNVGDVDQKQATLFIRRGKFGKERLAPLSPSTLTAVREWLDQRAGYADNDSSAPLFMTAGHRRLNRYQAAHAFRRLCLRGGVTGKPAPRLHDLRHNYACRCLALWREAGEDVDALLPVLANVMGHVDFHATEVYVHIEAAALRQASLKFHKHVHPHTEYAQ
jgi:site-specific recombinase XerD